MTLSNALHYISFNDREDGKPFFAHALRVLVWQSLAFFAIAGLIVLAAVIVGTPFFVWRDISSVAVAVSTLFAVRWMLKRQFADFSAHIETAISRATRDHWKTKRGDIFRDFWQNALLIPWQMVSAHDSLKRKVFLKLVKNVKSSSESTLDTERSVTPTILWHNSLFPKLEVMFRRSNDNGVFETVRPFGVDNAGVPLPQRVSDDDLLLARLIMYGIITGLPAGGLVGPGASVGGHLLHLNRIRRTNAEIELHIAALRELGVTVTIETATHGAEVTPKARSEVSDYLSTPQSD